MAGPELIAHRGWARRHPENTLAAVRGALGAGARYVEVDVQLSSDGVPFLFHDRTLERVCGVAGRLCDRSSAAVAELRASERGRFGARFADEPVARLDGLADLLSTAPGVAAFVELKRASIEVFGPSPMLDAVLPALAQIEDRSTLISFDLGVLGLARERSQLPVGPVLETWDQRDSAEVAALEPEVVFCDVDRTPLRGPLRRPRGRLALYEIDDAALARELHARGADLIETFAIGEMLAALERAP